MGIGLVRVWNIELQNDGMGMSLEYRNNFQIISYLCSVLVGAGIERHILLDNCGVRHRERIMIPARRGGERKEKREEIFCLAYSCSSNYKKNKHELLV